MDNFINKTEDAKTKYSKYKNNKWAVVLICRCIALHKILEIHNKKTASIKENDYLDIAYNTAVAAYNQNKSSVFLVFLLVYINIEKNDYTSAQSILKSMEINKNFYKTEMVDAYEGITYLKGILAAKKGKMSSAKKELNILNAIYTENNSNTSSAFTGSLAYEINGDIEHLIYCYLNCLDNGFISPFIFIQLYDIINIIINDISLTISTKNTNYFYYILNNENFTYIMHYFIKWLVNKKIDISSILSILNEHQKREIFLLVKLDLLIEIFDTYKDNEALYFICKRRVDIKETSYQALGFYKKALLARFQIENMEQVITTAAYENEYMSLPMFVLEKAEQSGNVTDNVLAFIYHIFITNSSNEFDLTKYEFKINEFAFLNLAKGKRGFYYNSIYKYLYDKIQNDAELANVLFDESCKYEIDFGNIKYVEPDLILLSLPHEREMRTINIVSSSSKIYIKSPTDNFNLYLFKNGGRDYLKLNKRIKTLIRNANLSFFERLLDSGYKSENILVCLSYKYLDINDMSNLDEKRITVLLETMNLHEISNEFKVEISRYLGKYYCYNKKYNSAIKYYNYIGIKNVKRNDCEYSLETFIKTENFHMALSLITEKHFMLSDVCLFNAIISLGKTSYTAEIAKICSNLVLRGWHDRKILDIITSCYKSHIKNYLMLANKIDSLGYFEHSLKMFEKIIVKSVSNRIYNEISVKGFISFYKIQPENDIILKFLYYCIYEIIINNKLIDDYNLNISFTQLLESIFLERNENKYLAYALCHIYMLSGLETLNKDYVISKTLIYMEEEGILFPIFKEFEINRTMITPFIEENTPFLYKGEPEKNIYFCYYISDKKSTDFDESKTIKIQMKYFRFGMYFTTVPVFYGDYVYYHFQDDKDKLTGFEIYHNSNIKINENSFDKYHVVNNGLLYSQMLKYNDVEKLIKTSVYNDTFEEGIDFNIL